MLIRDGGAQEARATWESMAARITFLTSSGGTHGHDHLHCLSDHFAHRSSGVQ